MDLPYFIDKDVQRMLNKSKKAVIEADQDRVFLITGPEGSGKSLLARQLGYFLDNDFSLDDICFDAESLEKRIRTKKRYGVVILDEGNRGLTSRSALTKQNKKLIGLIQEMRQLNLFFFICIPSVFLIEKYIVLYRSHGLFHTSIYKKDYKKRYYKIYNRKNLKDLYIKGQKYMSYSKPRIHKKRMFYGKQVPSVTKEDYDKKKLQSFREEDKKKPDEVQTWRIQRDIMISEAHNSWKVKNSVIAELFRAKGVPLEPQSIGRIAQNT